MTDLRKNHKKILSDFNQHGYHIEPAVFTFEECDHLIAQSHDFENARSGSYRPQMMPHRINDAYLNALKNKKIVNLIEIFCEGEPVGLQTEFFFCKPGTRGFSLHQDNFFVEANYGVFLTAWVALTDIYPEKGGLIVYPGSHKEGLLPIRKICVEASVSQDPNANNEECVVPEVYKPVHATVPKGSALFIHGHLVHASNMNTTNEFRYVLLCTYIRAGEKFRVGKYAQRNVVQLT